MLLYSLAIDGCTMKITIDVEATPEEVREVLGLPDVTAFYEELFVAVKQQMAQGAEGYDPLTLLKPLMASQPSLDQFQKMMAQMMSAYTAKGGKGSD